MHKKIMYLLLILICSFVSLNVVSAKTYNVSTISVNHSLAGVKENCEAVFGDPNDKDDIAYFLQQIFDLIKFGGPILALVLCMFDFVKAVTASDKDALIKAGKTSVKRIIFALMLFFIPVLINAIFGMVGFYGTCGIS